MYASKSPCSNDCTKYRQPRTLRSIRYQERSHCTNKHHSLYSKVQDARALCENPP